jgi:hypothetical protein
MKRNENQWRKLMKAWRQPMVKLSCRRKEWPSMANPANRERKRQPKIGGTAKSESGSSGISSHFSSARKRAASYRGGMA